jgi:hypothetical protein
MLLAQKTLLCQRYCLLSCLMNFCNVKQHFYITISVCNVCHVVYVICCHYQLQRLFRIT